MTKIYEADTHILIHTDHLVPDLHCHKAAHIIVSLDGSMNVTSDSREYQCQGIMIPSGIRHQVDTHGHSVLVFLLDSTTNVSTKMQNTSILSENTCKFITATYCEMEKSYSFEQYNIFVNSVFDALGFACTNSCVTDPRIASAMEHIRSRLSENITCQEIAASVFLSEGRFSHLFKQQVGMTFASYLIYQRILYVYTKILGGISITEAAISAGFSGSSHFADVNRRVFGLSATAITRDMEFIKVH